MNKIEFLKDTLDRIQGWINSADHKVSIFLAFQGIVLTIVAPNTLGIIKEAYTRCYLSSLLLISAGAILFLFSMLMSILTVSPKLRAPKSSSSLTYFGSINDMSKSDYKKKVGLLTESIYETELLNQVYINSQIASTKHTRFKYTVTLFVFGSLAMVAGYGIYFVRYGY